MTVTDLLTVSRPGTWRLETCNAIFPQDAEPRMECDDPDAHFGRELPPSRLRVLGQRQVWERLYGRV